MKDAVLLELAKRWELDAEVPPGVDLPISSSVQQSVEAGERNAKRECADALRMLVQLLGEK